MARKTKSERLDTLEREIEEAVASAQKAKDKYDAELARVKDLMNKRDALRNETLIEAISKSKRSYKEILQFIQGNDDENEE